MENRMNIEQFVKTKKEIITLAENYDAIIENNTDTSEAEEEILNKYFKIIDELTKYDLSEIPYELWEDMLLVGTEDHTIDLSKTNANIDFKIVEYSNYINYKSCKIRNLSENENFLDEKNFDKKTIAENQDIFLSNNFDETFKRKYYDHSLLISDLKDLTDDQIKELDRKKIINHISYSEKSILLDNMEIKKVIELYNYSPEDYNSIIKLFDTTNFIFRRLSDQPYENTRDLKKELESIEISNVKKVLYDYIKGIIINSDFSIEPDDYPEDFIKENEDLFLIGVDIPNDVKERYFLKRLKINDLLNYPEEFKNIPVEKFLRNNIRRFIIDNYGESEFEKIFKKYKETFKLLEDNNDFFLLGSFLSKKETAELSFCDAVKNYVLEYKLDLILRNNDLNSSERYIIPSWLEKYDFNIIDKINNKEDLLNYNDLTLILNNKYRKAINILGIENIKRIEQEMGFFFHNQIDGLENEINNNNIFNAFASFFNSDVTLLIEDKEILGNRDLSYEDFLDNLAKYLNYMKKYNFFTDYDSYDWIQGKFRDDHPEIFIDVNAPEELKNAFYKNKITLDFLLDNKEYIQYLKDKNVCDFLNAKINIHLKLDNGEKKVVDFIKEYSSRYGNEKTIELCLKYGKILSNMHIKSLNGEIENEEQIEKQIRKEAYETLYNISNNYSYLKNIPEMVEEYPDIFVEFDNISDIDTLSYLTNAFYTGSLKFSDIKEHPEIIEELKDKNLIMAFKRNCGYYIANNKIFKSYWNFERSDLDLLQVIGNENFLELCSIYGNYLTNIGELLYRKNSKENNKYIAVDTDGNNNEMSFEEIKKQIENITIERFKSGECIYNPFDVPEFVKEKNKELFLDEDAPSELKTYFYNVTKSTPMTFKMLGKNKQWLPYLEGKEIIHSFLNYESTRDNMIKYFDAFGIDKGIKLGINRSETVEEMINANKVELMKSWYDKTGGKFIPDFVVMQNFDLEEADKFLESGSNWSSLMRIKSFAETPEARDAMLKLAYSFGAFDHDVRGFKKVYELLTNLPRKIEGNQKYIIDSLDNHIDLIITKIESINMENSINKIDEQSKEDYIKMLNNIKNYFNENDKITLDLLISLKEEDVDIDFSKPLFSQIYRKNEDGSYTLTINNQKYRKTSQAIRKHLEKYEVLPIITPQKAHKFFGGLNLEYNPKFRDFLLSNFDTIINNDTYLSKISSIQKRFNEIKAVYSNVNLTLDLAISYIDDNKYTNVNIGNEKVLYVASLQNYSQKDFETIQKIFNYGKQRVFSSIPRIEKKQELNFETGKYKFEILRLDDPRAMSIGFESDCCQRLGEAAEMCMEHSMVDKNGRVFIITNESGELIAQSWVWRNKDVLCFDNIEVPDKKMWDNGIPKGDEDLGIRNQFTDDILEIYKIAAHELIEKDEKEYKKLLEEGKITQEEYDGLRLGKITVGLGYSNIKGSIKTLKIDEGIISRSLPFEEPVELSRGLYTSDSTTQYILEERKDRKNYLGDTLTVHKDEYIEHDDDNFTQKDLLSLIKLELETKNNPNETEIYYEEYMDKEHIVTKIANNYGLNPENTRIIIHPNFAIIYEINDDNIKIGDLLYNTKVDNLEQQMNIEDKVAMQIRTALDQISGEKAINVSMLNDNQKNMYSKAKGLTDEIDIERGVFHGKK